jgi:signal-transduction protein with cAMP-binding, CBS, and nucleotidyltransferase domain
VFLKKDPFDTEKPHHISLLESLKASLQSTTKNVDEIQAEITEAFTSILKDITLGIETQLGKSPCNYAIFAGGSVGRRETSMYSDVEFGIIVEKKDNIDYFLNLGSRVATHLDEIGIECDENFRFRCSLAHM